MELSPSSQFEVDNHMAIECGNQLNLVIPPNFDTELIDDNSTVLADNCYFDSLKLLEGSSMFVRTGDQLDLLPIVLSYPPKTNALHTNLICQDCMGKGSKYQDFFTDKPCKTCDGSGLSPNDKTYRKILR